MTRALAQKLGTETHNLKCANSIRARRLVLAGDPSVPSTDLLHEIADEIAAHCGHTRLKAHRLAWDWTVEQATAADHQMCREHGLGDRAFADRSWNGWEAGSPTSRAYQDLLCRLFATSAVRLGFASDHTSILERVVSTGPEDLPSRSDSNTLMETAQGGDPTDRRRALTALSGAAIGVGFGELFIQSAAEAMEFTRRAEASDLGPQTLEHLDLVITAVAADFAHTPPSAMFPRVLQYRRQVASLLDGKHTLRQKRALYRYAGWLSIALGWLAQDLGDVIAADAHCIDAWEHGWQAEDGEICGWSMDTAATVAMYNNRPERARDASIRGLSQAPANSSASVRLSCQLTRAYGRLRESDHFDTTLSKTRRLFDRLPEPGSGLFSADAGRISSYAATSSLWLCRPDEAVTYAQDALSFYADVDPGQQSPTREAISRLDLSLALLATNTPDGAAEEALRAMDCERLTGTLLTRAGEVEAAIRRSHPTLGAGRRVQERLREVTVAARAITSA